MTSLGKAILCLIIAITVFSRLTFRISGTATEEAEATVPSVRASALAEAGTGTILSGVNLDAQISAGTITKLMTALLAAEAIQSGQLSPDVPLTCSSSASGCGGAIIWLAAGEKITLDELFTALLAGNANDAALVLAEAISGNEQRFTALMNQRAEALGMNDTLYKNCTGIDADGQYTTARDVVRLCSELIRHEHLFKHMTVWRCFVRSEQTEIVNTNDLVKSYDGIIGLKYSETKASGCSVAAAARRDNETYISLVFGEADKNVCLKSAKALLNSGFDSYMVTEPPNYILPSAEVHRGTSGSVAVHPQALTHLVVPEGTADRLSAEIFMPQWIDAPVDENERVGRLVLYLDDEPVYDTPLLASESVPEVSHRYIFRLLFSSLLT